MLDSGSTGRARCFLFYRFRRSNFLGLGAGARTFDGFVQLVFLVSMTAGQAGGRDELKLSGRGGRGVGFAPNLNNRWRRS